jgi:hypothetical protein
MNISARHIDRLIGFDPAVTKVYSSGKEGVGVAYQRQPYPLVVLGGRKTAHTRVNPTSLSMTGTTTQGSGELPGVSQKTIIGLTLLGSSGQPH